MLFETPQTPNTAKKESRYINHTYSGLSEDARQKFMEESDKLLGLREREGGSETAVLISGSHALDWIEDTTKIVTQEDVDHMNKKAGNVKERYNKTSQNTLLIGKQYIQAGQRPNWGGYKADTNVGPACIELQDLISEESPRKTPHVILYELPQTHAEPNKVDANNPNAPAIDLEVFKKSGAGKLVDYILESGVDNISSSEIIDVIKGTYTPSKNNMNDKVIALTECASIKKKMIDNKHRKALSATLRVLGIHRKYYEEQERLLYEKTTSQYPVNIDIHTCFDTKKTKQGADMVIGSTFGESVHSIEVEYLFAAILKKHNFNAVLSTLNSFPQASRKNLNALHDTIDKTIDNPTLLTTEQKNILSAIDHHQRYELEAKALSIFNKRLNKFLNTTEVTDGILSTLCFRYNIESNTTDPIAMKEAVVEHTKNLISDLSDDDLKLFTKQSIISEAMNDKLHYDNPVQGLWGLTSLASKYNARDKYTTPNRPEIRPTILQLETVTMIMKDPEKRASMERALQEFIRIVQQEDFEPRKALEDILSNA